MKNITTILALAFGLLIQTTSGFAADYKSLVSSSAEIYWQTETFDNTWGSSKTAPKTSCFAGKQGDSLYILFVCEDSQLTSLVNNPNPKHYNWDDSIEVYLDADRDMKDYHHLIVTAQNELWSAYHAIASARSKQAWSGASSKTSVNNAGGYWTCEILVPFSSLKGTPQKGDIWGVNFCRNYRGQFNRGYLLESWFPVFNGKRDYHQPEFFGVFVWPGKETSTSVFASTPVQEPASSPSNGTSGNSQDNSTPSNDNSGSSSATVTPL